MSIKKRIQILLAFLVGIPLLLLLYESYHTSRKTLIAEMKREALHIARLETVEMDVTFDNPRTIVEALVRSLESDPQFVPDQMLELLRRTLHETPEIYGICIALDPDLTPLKRFAPYAFRRNGTETLIALPYKYTERDWYRVPLKHGRGRWINPYYGEGGEALMVSYVAPLKRGGVVVGMVAVDLDLAALLKKLHSLKPGSDGAVYLVNRGGKILAHPALKPIADMPVGEGGGELMVLMKNSKVDAVKMKDPVTHKTSWVVESPIRSLSAERGGEDWSLIVSWTLDKKLAPLNSMGRRMIVLYLFLGGAALWFLNRTIDDVVIRPIQRLTQQARCYSSGDFTRQADIQHDTLELKELGQALNQIRVNSEKNNLPLSGSGGDTP